MADFMAAALRSKRAARCPQADHTHSLTPVLPDSFLVRREAALGAVDWRTTICSVKGVGWRVRMQQRVELTQTHTDRRNVVH